MLLHDLAQALSLAAITTTLAATVYTHAATRSRAGALAGRYHYYPRCYSVYSCCYTISRRRSRWPLSLLPSLLQCILMLLHDLAQALSLAAITTTLAATVYTHA